jgi:flagellar motor switch/type III secretory pathway protein FliN
VPQTGAQTATAQEAENRTGSDPVNELRWSQAESLPCKLSVQARVPGFTLKNLLNLGPQTIVRSQLASSASPPLRVNGEVVAWCDFEVLGSRLAVRVTELA